MPQWRQGEHVALIGQTGSGKTFLLGRLLEYRADPVVLRTKSDDIRFTGFRRIKRLAQMTALQRRYLLQPKFAEQASEAHKLFEMAYRRGGYCVAVDELYYVVDRLRLQSDIVMLLTQGRSLNVSVVTGMQRPSYVPRWAISEPEHVFSFAVEGRDAKTIAEATTPRMRDVLEQLGRHEFAYFYRPTREIYVGKAQQLREFWG